MTRLGKYQLHEILGRGGYGTVYRATDTALEVDRAVKVLHPALAADPEFIERFRREARLAARLRHPNIAPVYDLDEDQGRYYLAMDYLPGGSLKDRLAKDGALPFAKALRITQQAAAALDYAHAQGLVHRDVKPGNILLEADGAARLIDFGFAKALAGASSASLSAAGGMVGTPSYMAPEVWREQTATPATDVYSLACVVCEMLTGQPLFPGESPAGLVTRHLIDGPQFPKQWPQDVPPGLSRVLEQALAKDPTGRYPSAGAFARALAELTAPPKIPAAPAPPRSTPTAQASRQTAAPTATAPAPRRSALPTWAWIIGAFAVFAFLAAALAGIGALVTDNQRKSAALTRAAYTNVTSPTIYFAATTGTFTITTTDTSTHSPTAHTPPSKTPTPAGPYLYTVDEGETLLTIAEKFGVDWQAILALNPTTIDPVTQIVYVGQQILIPLPNTDLPTATPVPTGLAPGTIIEYTVMSGDTLFSIAERFNSTPEEIVKKNPDLLTTATDPMYVGWILKIPVNLLTSTPQPTTTPTAPQGMVLIPAGTFQMGSNVDDALNECLTHRTDCMWEWYIDEQPIHTITLSTYYLDVYEVTNEQYANFLNALENQSEGGTTWLDTTDGLVRIHQSGTRWIADTGYENHPVNQVTWYGANAYCTWREARLPTEAEWEYAARGGLDNMNYPWGNESPVCTPGASNGAQFEACDERTLAVGTFGSNGYGLYDMAGNAYEWVNDWYGKYSPETATNPSGPSSGTYRALRGGCWCTFAHNLRVAYRNNDNPTAGYGFRCAADAP